MSDRHTGEKYLIHLVLKSSSLLGRKNYWECVRSVSKYCSFLWGNEKRDSEIIYCIRDLFGIAESKVLSKYWRCKPPFTEIQARPKEQYFVHCCWQSELKEKKTLQSLVCHKPRLDTHTLHSTRREWERWSDASILKEAQCRIA